MDVVKVLKIEFKSDFRINSGFGMAGLLDYVSLKNSRGISVIPGSTLKGVLRMACTIAASALQKNKRAESYLSKNQTICQLPDHPDICKSDQFKERCIICRLFGSVFRPGAIFFADALPASDQQDEITAIGSLKPLVNPAQSIRRNNVKISRWNRISEPKMLRSAETVSKELIFSSKVYLNVLRAHSAPSREDLDLLYYGASLITHLGSEKARGLGRCTVTVEDSQ